MFLRLLWLETLDMYNINKRNQQGEPLDTNTTRGNHSPVKRNLKAKTETKNVRAWGRREGRWRWTILPLLSLHSPFFSPKWLSVSYFLFTLTKEFKEKNKLNISETFKHLKKAKRKKKYRTKAKVSRGTAFLRLTT